VKLTIEIAGRRVNRLAKAVRGPVSTRLGVLMKLIQISLTPLIMSSCLIYHLSGVNMVGEILAVTVQIDLTGYDWLNEEP
jgi:hypothetical protein